MAAYQARVDQDRVDVDLILQLLEAVVAPAEEGAVLVFLPGACALTCDIGLASHCYPSKQIYDGRGVGLSVFSFRPLPFAYFGYTAGLDDILRLRRLLGDHPKFGTQRFQLLVLHSAISPVEQHKAFRRPPKVCTKLFALLMSLLHLLPSHDWVLVLRACYITLCHSDFLTMAGCPQDYSCDQHCGDEHHHR